MSARLIRKRWPCSVTEPSATFASSKGFERLRHEMASCGPETNSARVPSVRFYPLAGGLGPNNVAEAIRAVRPAVVDSKTKTDRDGSHQKDLGRVRRFQEAAWAATVGLL